MDQKYAFLEKVGREPSNLIKGLQAVQGAEGYVSDESIEAIAEYFGIPAVEVEGVLSFYAQFKRVKPGKYKIAVCDGTACHIKGSPLIQEWLKRELGISSGDLQKKIIAQGTPCEYFETFDEIENYLLENISPGDLLITMGAGDIVKVGENLLGM